MQQAGEKLFLTSSSSGCPHTGPQRRPNPRVLKTQMEMKWASGGGRTTLCSNKTLRKGDRDGAWQRAKKKRPRDQKTRACFNPVLIVSAEREAFQNTGYQETIFFIFKMFSHGESTCTLHPSDCTCPSSRLSNSDKIVYFWKIEDFNTAAILRRTPDPRERERERKKGLIWGEKNEINTTGYV